MSNGRGVVNEYGNVFTTGQVAKLCKVASRTVCQWIDSGLLNGYRIPSTGKRGSVNFGEQSDRRVLRGDLIRFLRENKMPFVVDPDPHKIRVLVVGVDAPTLKHFEDDIGDKALVTSVSNLFDAGIAYAGGVIQAVVLDGSLITSEIVTLTERLPSGVPAVGIPREDETDGEWKKWAGCREIIPRPFLISKLTEAVVKVARMIPKKNKRKPPGKKEPLNVDGENQILGFTADHRRASGTG